MCKPCSQLHVVVYRSQPTGFEVKNPVLFVCDFQRPVGALIDAVETEAEPTPTPVYNKVPAALLKTIRCLSVFITCPVRKQWEAKC